MGRAQFWRVWVGVVLVAGLASSCAKKGRGTQDPNACLRQCDQEECEYRAGGVGDNEVYLQCLEGCQKRCS